MSKTLSKMNLISAVQQLPKEDIETIQGYVEMIEEENQELKEKLDEYENPEDMTLMMMWCTEKVKDENEKLKKQLEEKENIACNWKDSCLENAGKIEILETQQKEFAKYLEDEIKELQKLKKQN